MKNISLLIMLVISCDPNSYQFHENRQHPKTYVFNLTGSWHGTGDIVAPLWVAQRFKKDDPDIYCILVVDNRASELIKQTTGLDPERFKDQYGCQLVPEHESASIPIADVSFELFIGGRRAEDFFKLKYNSNNTIVIVSDTMHGKMLDHITVRGLTFYFMPPGIGKERSGIIDDLYLDSLVPIPILRRAVAQDNFKDQKIKNIIRESSDDILLGFAYGIHNEVMYEYLHGQTKAFLWELAKTYPSKTILVLTPNKMDDLKKAVDQRDILEIDHLPDLDKLDKRPYLVIVPRLSSSQFISLMAISDVPVLVEGDNAIGQALRLDKNFLVLKSDWNSPAIQSLVEYEALTTNQFHGVYNLSGPGVPNWGAYFAQGERKKSHEVPDFVNKLRSVIKVAKVVRAQGKNTNFEDLSKDSFLNNHDRYLQYSIMFSGERAGLVTPKTLSDFRTSLEQQKIDWKSMQERFEIRTPPHYRFAPLLRKGN